jgi:protocatechuate 3,4-dioxygenase beta subunit
MRWFPSALIFAASFAAAQTPPSTAPAPDSEQKKIRLEGIVLSLNGEAVRKATVRLQGSVLQPGQVPSTYSETTDNEGKFVFEDVPAGRYTLSAEKPGFVTSRYGARSNTSPGTQLMLAAGAEMKDLSIKMTPQGVIAGKVLDQDGDPVATAQVQAMRYSYVRGRKQLQQTGGATTNDLGEYRVGNLPPGRYYLSASDRRAALILTPDRPGRASAGQEGNITTYYPNGTDAASGVPVDVAAGGEMRGVDIRLRKAKVYTVRGKAVDSSGMPVMVLVAFTRKDEGLGLVGVINGGGLSQLRPDGTFEFRNIVPGIYILQVLQANVNGTPQQNVTGHLEVTVADANIDNLILPMGPGPEITGTVSLEGGEITTLLKPAQNAAGGTASAGNSPAAFPPRFTLTLNDTQGVSVNTPNTQVKDDGTFRFNAVGTSKYLLNAVILPQGTYLKSARYGGQDVTHAPIDTTSGSGGTLDVVLSSKAADLGGSVQNDKGEALAGVIVTLWPKTPDGSPTGGARQTNTDQNGGYRFQGLAPGDYYVAAWEELEPGLATSADFLGNFNRDSSAIKLSESGHEGRDIKPVPSDKIALEMAKLP